MAKCRVKDCYTTKIQRFGLCNKHRKWVEKGYMTQDLVMIKYPTRVGSYKGMTCRIPDCTEKPRRNKMCQRHSSKFARGTMDLAGHLSYKRPLRYSVDATCKVHNCGKGGKITKGFCKTDYERYRKGNLDYDGFPTGRQKRVHKYTEEDRCKIKGCEIKPRDRGFCHNHSQAWRKGIYTLEGRRIKQVLVKNQGRACSVTGCKYGAHAKTYCRTHYRRYRLGLPIVNEMVNKGKTCVHQGCQKPASCKGFCSLHYYRFMNDIPLNGNTFLNKVKACTSCLAEAAYCKGLCRKCYGVDYRKKQKPITLNSSDHVST